ncbi:MAG: hypothetical protein ACRD2D_05040 [Terriglobales bacterium]
MGTGAVAWVLVFHMIGMVMWIGGLFLAMAAAGAGAAELAQRGLRRFAHPGAALMIITGALMMVLLPFVRDAMWLHVKLLLVLLLIVADLLVTARLRKSAPASRARLGVYHSAIGILFLGILILALVKPF